MLLKRAAKKYPDFPPGEHRYVATLQEHSVEVIEDKEPDFSRNVLSVQQVHSKRRTHLHVRLSRHTRRILCFTQKDISCTHALLFPHAYSPSYFH